MTTRRAFTLVELLVVMAIVGVLAAMLLPALASAKRRAHAALCSNNQKQLQLAWILYANDNHDRLVPHGEALFGPPRTEVQHWWAQGHMSYAADHADNTNTALLVDSRYARLGEYTRTAAIYKCPADRASAPNGGRQHRRVRTVSMNVYLGRIIDCLSPEPLYVGPRTVADIPNPGLQFVFLDEHPDSLGSVSFWTSRSAGGAAKILSFPGALHHGAGSLSFADGHVEAHLWRDPRTTPPVRHEQWLAETESPHNRDVAWLQQRTLFPED